MADSTKTQKPSLSLRGRLGLVFTFLSIVPVGLFTALAAPFRGNSGARTFQLHLGYAIVRHLIGRLSSAQVHYLEPSTEKAYQQFAKEKGFTPDTVALPHNTHGHWIGNKNATNVLVYYHGGGFERPAAASYFEFSNRIVKKLNANGKETAVFFLNYTLTPIATYPTQIRQAVEGLRYILETRGYRPSDVIVGGDSAGGNLVFAVLSHIAHPHPQIKPLELSEPLRGAFGIAPWISYDQTWPSVQYNSSSDLITEEGTTRWSNAYLDGTPRDPYNEAITASSEWWESITVSQILIIAGTDEIFISSVEAFYEKLKAGFKNVRLFVGEREAHVSPVYEYAVGERSETQQERELISWLHDLF